MKYITVIDSKTNLYQTFKEDWGWDPASTKEGP